MNWRGAYDLLNNYVAEYGNAAVPFELIYKDYPLGHWRAKQLYLYRNGKLSEEKTELLSAIETFGLGTHGTTFSIMFELAKEYRQRFGDLNIPKRYTIEKDGTIYNLGKWIEQCRYQNKKGKLSAKKKEMLDTIDMKWDGVATFNKVSFNESAVLFYVRKKYPDAVKYQENGVELDIYIPSLNLAIEYDGMAFHDSKRDHQKNLYCKKHGINIIRIREKGCEELNDGISKNYYINKRNIASLESVITKIFPDINDTDITRDSQEIYGIHNSTLTQNWKECYAIAKEYYKKYGNLLIKYNAIIDNKKMGIWINTQRKRYKQGLLSNERIALLEEIGMVWQVRQTKKCV